MDVTVVLLLLLHSVRGTELLEPSAQPTNFSLPEDSDAWAYASMLFGNETEDSPSFQENVTNATMNNTETDLYITGSNETWTSKEDVDNYDRTFDNASTNDTNLNITDTNDTNNTNTSKDEMGSGFSDAESGETTPSPDYNITKSNNPEDITTITTIAATTSGINSTTTSTTTTTASTSTTSTNSSLDDRRDIVYTENNRAVDSAGSNTRNNNATAWAIVIGTAMAVGVVSLIVYILKKRRDHRDFNHRKLVEDLPAGPVLRLDSYENLGMGTLAFNNPVLQGDDIHMDHMGGSQNKH